MTGVARIGLSGSGTDATGYRIAATVARPPLIGRAPALILRTYNDLVLLSKGKVSEFVMFSALLTPPSRAFEDRTARALLDQLGVRAA